MSTDCSQYVHVRALKRMDQFVMLVYTPRSSANERWEFSADFLYEVLQFAQFRHLRLPDPDLQDQAHSSSVQPSQDIVTMIQTFLRSSQRLLVIRHVINYVRQYRLQRPRFEMLPHVIASKQQLQLAQMLAEEREALSHRHRLVVFVQAQVRRQLARKACMRLAMVWSFCTLPSLLGFNG